MLSILLVVFFVSLGLALFVGVPLGLIAGLREAKKRSDKAKLSRAEIQIPNEWLSLIDWLQKHDPRFGGDRTAVLVEIFRTGAEKIYSDGLRTSAAIPREVVNLGEANRR